MADPKFKKGAWVVRMHGDPDDDPTDPASIGDIVQVAESGSRIPYTAEGDIIDQDDYRLATPEEVEGME